MNGRGSISDEEFLRGGGVRQQDSNRAAEIERTRREIEERTLDSSHRSLGLLYESEKVGIATAEELNRQKEQLKSTERRLDDINATLNQSERHLQGAKSVLGGIMNYFSGRNRPAGGKQQSLQVQQQAPMPDQRRGVPPSPNPPSLLLNPSNTNSSSNSSTPLYYNGKNSEEILERNLDEMSMGLSRLKVLAHGLNKEMDEHNGIIDRIDDGVGKNAWRIEKQNKDMNKLLKK